MLIEKDELDSDFTPSEILLHLRDPAELKKIVKHSLLLLSTRGKKGLGHELLYSNGIQKIVSPFPPA